MRKRSLRVNEGIEMVSLQSTERERCEEGGDAFDVGIGLFLNNYKISVLYILFYFIEKCLFNLFPNMFQSRKMLSARPMLSSNHVIVSELL